MRRVVGVVIAAAVLMTAALGVTAWRLAQGPLDITWLAQQVAAHAAPEPTAGGAAPAIRPRIRIGSAALAWEGWTGGLDSPLDIRLDRISATGPEGTTLAAIPHARVSLSLAWLLVGRLVPRAVEIDGARLHAVRAADGRITTVLGSVAPDATDRDLGDDPFGALLRELARPVQTDASAGGNLGRRWSQLRRVRIADAGLMLADRQLGVVWLAPKAMIDLRRGPGGGVDGQAELTLAVGNQSTQLSATARLEPGGAATAVHARFTKIAPAALAHLSPDLVALNAIDAPIDGGIDLSLDPQFDVAHAKLDLRMGTGNLQLAQSNVPVAGANLVIDADRKGLTLSQARVTFGAANGAAGPVLAAKGTIGRAATGYAARLSLDLDQVGFATLPQYWPRDAAPGARGWITTNITAGTARAAHVDLSFSFGGARPLQVTAATGQITGDDITLSWLRPVPPIEHGQATVNILSPDELLITTAGAHQVGGAMRVVQGNMRITGLAQKDQTAALDINLVGPLADAWALLHQPRLQLLSRHPVDVGEPTGQFAGRLTLTLPLEDKVTIDQIPIHAQGQLSDVHLVVAGRNLDQGTLDFDVTADGLKMSGPAKLAAIPAQLNLQMDFRPGPPQQVQIRLTAAGDATIDQLDAAGLDSGGILAGAAALTATLEERRDGSAQISVHADLQHTGIGVAATGWRHETGGTATGDAHILLDHDHIVGIDRLTVEGDGISVLGRAEYSASAPVTLHLEKLVLGATRASGLVLFGRPPDRALRIELSGPSLDLSGRFTGHHNKPAKPATADEKGPPWSADIHFGQVLLAEHRQLASVSLVAESDGLILRHAQIGGRTGSNEAFSLAVTPEAGGRRLVAEAADLGALLAATDTLHAIQGGRLSVSGRFDDARPDHRLSGSAEINDFHVRGAPIAAKLLQAMTLYGLVDALDGPGLAVTRMVVPFGYAHDKIELTDVRAYSASLGATVKGQVDLANETADLQGTIVPAYFFNTLLGGLPVVGHLFSPEKGGGVFSATYTVHGPLSDPSISVNPLAALTPGFLRGIFGAFDK